MLQIFKTEDGRVRPEKEISKNCWIACTDPTNAETEMLCERFGIDIADFRAPLDEEETARVQTEDNYSLILVDIPVIEERNKKDWYGTIPLAIILTEEVILTVCLEETPILTGFMEGKVKTFHTHMRARFILQILFRCDSLYLQYLRTIDRKSDEIQEKLHKSTRNRELIELLELEKSLVYFTTSLKSNEAVLEKLLKSPKFKRYEEDEDLLEDVMIENRQAIEMANIYSGILSGTMDAYASVISNNQNIVMKTLTIVTIVLSIPTIVSSYYGMNVRGIPFAEDPRGFLITISMSLILMLVTAIIFIKSFKF